MKSTDFSILDKIADDPAKYAIRVALFLVALFLAFAVFAQTEFQLACQDGVCYMKESDVEKLQALINWMARRIMELQSGVCT